MFNVSSRLSTNAPALFNFGTVRADASLYKEDISPRALGDLAHNLDNADVCVN